MNNCITFKHRENKRSDDLFSEVLGSFVCALSREGYACSCIKTGGLCKYFLVQTEKVQVAVVMYSDHISPDRISVLCHNYLHIPWWRRLFQKQSFHSSEIHAGDELRKVLDIIKNSVGMSTDYYNCVELRYAEWKRELLAVSSHEKWHFDVLTGQEKSYRGFGEILWDNSERRNSFEALADDAAARVEQVFGVDLSDRNNVATTLDRVISEMQLQGWNPRSGNINLFCTDFGLILTRTIQETVGGTLVFRSETDLNHVSLHWCEAGVEVFPFHKVLKRLVAEEGESLEAFVGGVLKMVRK